MIKFILNNIPARKFDVRVVSLAPNELLKGRVALITGGTSGIGFHMAKAFLRSGAAVVITGRSEERLRLACGELNEDDHYKGRLFGLVMDNTRVDCQEPCPLWCYGERDSARAYGHPDVVERWSR